MKIVSFSLYKSDRKNLKTYTEGAIINVNLVKKFYDGFVPRFYVQSDLKEIGDKLVSMGAEVIYKKNESKNQKPALWRYDPLISGEFEVVFFRDTDSRISIREKKLVDIFLNCEKNFHVIRDNVGHKNKIMAGMWGAKKTNEKIKKTIKNCFLENGEYGFEEFYFNDYLWDIIKYDVLEHDSNKNTKDFIKNPDNSFIGKSFML